MATNRNDDFGAFLQKVGGDPPPMTHFQRASMELKESAAENDSEDSNNSNGERGEARPSIIARRLKMRITANRTLWSTHRLAIARIMESNAYNGIMACIIITNLLHSVFETNFRANDDMPEYMVLMSRGFLIIYTTDLVIRIYCYRVQFFFQTFNLFDAFIVLSDLAMLLMESLLGDIPSMSILRGLRMLRIIRVIRSAVAFRELYLMMQGIVSALRAIAFGTILLLVVLVLWSILAVEILQETNIRLDLEGAYGECPRCHKAFASVGDAMLTFMMSIIAGDSWGLLAVPLLEESTAAFFILIPAFISLQLGLMNVVAAVIVDRQAQARLDDEKLQHQIKNEDLQKSYTRLKALFTIMDEDESGCLTLDELVESYKQNPEFKQLLEMMDISIHDMTLVFGILDQDKTGDVSYEEFVHQLHYMGTANQRTLSVFIKHLAENLQDMIQDHEKILRRLAGAQGVRVSESTYFQRPIQRTVELNVIDDHVAELTDVLLPKAVHGANVAEQALLRDLEEHTQQFIQRLRAMGGFEEASSREHSKDMYISPCKSAPDGEFDTLKTQSSPQKVVFCDANGGIEDETVKALREFGNAASHPPVAPVGFQENIDVPAAGEAVQSHFTLEASALRSLIAEEEVARPWSTGQLPEAVALGRAMFITDKLTNL